MYPPWIRGNETELSDDNWHVSTMAAPNTDLDFAVGTITRCAAQPSVKRYKSKLSGEVTTFFGQEGFSMSLLQGEDHSSVPIPDNRHADAYLERLMTEMQEEIYEEDYEDIEDVDDSSSERILRELEEEATGYTYEDFDADNEEI
jgi:hypothetical protein